MYSSYMITHGMRVLGVRPAAAGTVDPGGVCADPEVLRLRLEVLLGLQQDMIDHCHFADRETARSSLARDEKIVELHGLSGFFVRTSDGGLKRVR